MSSARDGRVACPAAISALELKSYYVSDTFRSSSSIPGAFTFCLSDFPECDFRREHVRKKKTLKGSRATKSGIGNFITHEIL